jgi:hypothetical protein
MADFKVVVADLDALSSGFSDEAKTYEGLIPSINPPAVDGGDGNLNSVLQALVETFDVAHHRVVESLNKHADDIKAARKSFVDTDSGAYFTWDGTRSLYDSLVPKELQP